MSRYLHKSTNIYTYLLKDHGADLEVRDGEGCTALHHAAREARPDCCQLLLDRGAEVGTRPSVARYEATVCICIYTDIYNVCIYTDIYNVCIYIESLVCIYIDIYNVRN